MNAAFRLLALASASAAVATLAWLGRPEWRYLPHAVAVAAVVAYAARRLFPRVAAALLFGTVPIVPVLCLLALGRFRFTHWAMWQGAALGIAWGARIGHGWSLTGWQRALAWWAAALSLTWPIVVAREADFTLALLAGQRAITTSIGISPIIVAAWVALVAAAQIVGILLYDWIQHRRARHDPDAVWPVRWLGAGIVVSCLIAVYQAAVDLSALSAARWAFLGRSTGGTADANVMGMSAAMIALPLTAMVWSRSRFAAAIVFILGFAGVWTSGSRGALGTIVAGILIYGVLRVRARGRSAFSVRGLTLAAAALIAVVAILGTLRAVGPVARMRGMLPEVSLAGVQSLLVFQLWTRNLYGPVSIAIIRDHPWVGTGVGGFHNQMIDYARQVFRTPLVADNAQNWYRHQLAELGLLGSGGWIVWLGGFLWYTLWRSPATDDAPADAARASLAAFGLGSLVGMPAQDPAILVVFWMLAALCTPPPAATPPTRTLRIVFAVAVAVLLAFVGATAYAARHDLRVPFRAARFDFDYTYGFDFESPERAWTKKHAVAVPRATDHSMRLTYWVDHPDAGSRPVQVEIWRNHERIVNRRLRQGIRETTYVPVEKGKRFVLEVKVDRTFRPSDHGAADTRELGLAMRWDFVPAAP